MGNWAKASFGQERFEDLGIVVAGTSKPEYEQKILGLFDEVLFRKDSVYHTYLVSKAGKRYPIVFNVYGAPAMVDVLAELHDGGCRTVIFVGYAYGGFQNIDVGAIVLPVRSYHFEGIYSKIDPDRACSEPDAMLVGRIAELLRDAGMRYQEGTNISVPAVTFQLPHANEDYRRIKPATVEMELSSCYARAHDLAMRAAGILIISDNRSHSIGDRKELKYQAKTQVLEWLIQHLERLHMPKLPCEREFDIDTHLASIIEDPEDETNIYRKSNQ